MKTELRENKKELIKEYPVKNRATYCFNRGYIKANEYKIFKRIQHLSKNTNYVLIKNHQLEKLFRISNKTVRLALKYLEMDHFIAKRVYETDKRYREYIAISS